MRKRGHFDFLPTYCFLTHSFLSSRRTTWTKRSGWQWIYTDTNDLRWNRNGSRGAWRHHHDGRDLPSKVCIFIFCFWRIILSWNFLEPYAICRHTQKLYKMDFFAFKLSIFIFLQYVWIFKTLVDLTAIFCLVSCWAFKSIDCFYYHADTLDNRGHVNLVSWKFWKANTAFLLDSPNG